MSSSSLDFVTDEDKEKAAQDLADSLSASVVEGAKGGASDNKMMDIFRKTQGFDELSSTYLPRSKNIMFLVGGAVLGFFITRGSK
jgi:hypothetical protein